jgi:cystathionine beta-synthase
MNEVYPYITEGIGEDFVPKNYDMSLIDKFELVTDKDGAVMARKISREEGIFVGYSAGTAVQGLLQLKNELKKDDLPVVILPDHGSRYVAKLYNDQWMMERGFLDVKTFKDIVNSRGTKRLVTLEHTSSVAEAVELMKKYEIEHIPVMNGNGLVGAISEGGLFQKLFSNPEIKTATVETVMEQPYPVVSYDMPVERLGGLINKDNGAVLAKDESGNYHIVTKYDVIQTLTK